MFYLIRHIYTFCKRRPQAWMFTGRSKTPPPPRLKLKYGSFGVYFLVSAFKSASLLFATNIYLKFTRLTALPVLEMKENTQTGRSLTYSASSAASTRPLSCSPLRQLIRTVRGSPTFSFWTEFGSPVATQQAGKWTGFGSQNRKRR